MQKLKARVYLKNNKKRAAILVVSFGLFFSLLYCIRFFIEPATYTDEVLMVKNAEKMQMAYINRYGDVCKTLDLSLWEPDSTATDNEKVRELNRAGAIFLEEQRKANPDGLVFLCNSLGISIRTFIGNSYYYAPMMEKEELRQLTDRLNLKVTGGRYPENPGEILVDERMLKNVEKSIGDTLYNENTVIVGTVKYPLYFAAGLDYEAIEYSDRDLYYINDGAIKDLKEYFRQFGIDAGNDSFAQVQIQADQVNAQEMVDQFRDELDLPINVMTYSIFFVLSVTLFFVYRLHVMDRYTEWCLYRSLGFSAKDVFFLAFREYFVCLLFSLFFAALCSVCVCFIGGILMTEKGIMFRYFLPRTLLQISGIVVLLTGVMQIPVVYAMSKVKTINAMEIE